MMQTCKICGREHGPLCPFVKAVNFDYQGDQPGVGRVTRVEYRDAGDAFEMFDFLTGLNDDAAA
jgi:hypothetical protein